MSKRIISAIVLLLLLTGCVSGTLLGRNYQRISPGMTKDDVVTYIGYPKNKQFGGNTEAWQYCATGVYTDFHVLVWIENDT